MKTIALFGSIHKEETLPKLRIFLDTLLSKNIQIVVDKALLQALSQKDFPSTSNFRPLEENLWESVSCAISFGGDGTFLRTVHKIQKYDVPILAINGGHLGFLTELDATEALEYIDRLLHDDFNIEERPLLATFENEEQFIGYAFNEVVLQRREIGSMINVETYIGKDYLADYLVDGLLVAAPSGSTAYSLSANGSIVAPQCPVLLLTPIAPHSLNMRPLVVPNNVSIELKVSSRNGTFSLVRDGELSVHPAESKITIRQSSQKIRMIRFGEHSFYDTLRTKLMWGKSLR